MKLHIFVVKILELNVFTRFSVSNNWNNLGEMVGIKAEIEMILHISSFLITHSIALVCFAFTILFYIVAFKLNGYHSRFTNLHINPL